MSVLGPPEEDGNPFEKVDELIYDAVMKAALEGTLEVDQMIVPPPDPLPPVITDEEKPVKKRASRKPVLVAPVEGETVPLPVAPAPPEEIDIGPYCVDCREDTTGQEKRQEMVRESVKVTGQKGEDDEPEVEVVLLKGWLCQDCQPFENPLIEATAQMLIQRNTSGGVRAAPDIRAKLREIGEEEMWARWHGPMVDQMEADLELETR